MNKTSWTTKTFGELALQDRYSIVDGPFGSNLKLVDYVPKGIPVLQGNNITGNRFKFTDIRFITEEKAKSLIRSKVVVGDLLIVKIGSVGYSAIINSLGGYNFAIIPANLMKVSLDTNVVVPEYVYQYLVSEQGVKSLRSIASSTAQPALSLSKVKLLKIPLPSKIENQQKIADILSTIDEEIQKTDQIIQKTEKLKQGLMNELLTKGIGHKKFKKTKLGEIPEEWKVVSVGQICKCIVPGRNKPKKFDGEIPWITIPNIKNSRINYDNSTKYVSRQELKRCGNKIIPINSVIMSCVGEFGIVSKTDREIVINQQLHAFLPSKVIDSNFLMYSLVNQKIYMENLATKTSVPYLNKTNCNSIPIAKPTIEEQRKIAQVILEVDRKIYEELSKKTKLEFLKQGLMQDIFSQKVEVN